MHGYIVRMKEEDAVRKACIMSVIGRRSRGRQKIRWKDGEERTLMELGLTQDAFDSVQWRRYI